MTFAAILFDFDGVLIESEYAGNRQIADYLTGDRPSDHAGGIDGAVHGAGRRTISSPPSKRWIGRPLPDDFHAARAAEDAARDARKGSMR